MNWRGGFSFLLFLLPPFKTFNSFIIQSAWYLGQIETISIWPWIKLEKAQNCMRSDKWLSWEIRRTVDLKNWPNWNYLNTAWLYMDNIAYVVLCWWYYIWILLYMLDSLACVLYMLCTIGWCWLCNIKHWIVLYMDSIIHRMALLVDSIH